MGALMQRTGPREATTVTATNFIRAVGEMITRTSVERETLVITRHRRPIAVLMSKQEYDRLLEGRNGVRDLDI